jgi:hypothetical protein
MPRTPKLFVRATHPDRPCPKIRTRCGPIIDGRDISMIYSDETVEVPNERFYRRRIIAGDLIEVPAPKVLAPKLAEKEE